MSHAPHEPSRPGARPAWVLWPDETLPAWAERLLGAVAELGPAAIAPGRVFCPDGAGAAPPAGLERAVVALPGDLRTIVASPEDPRRERISQWIRSGATLLVPTRTGAGLLADALGAARDQCHVTALPLPGVAALPAATPTPADGYIVVDRPIWQALHPYLRALRLAGCRRHVVLVADDAGPQLAPGGDIALGDLVPGAEVSAVLDRDQVVAGAAAIVRIETAVDAGWELRRCLASGRPLVVNGEPAVLEHLEAVGAAAYLYPGLDDCIQAAEATLAALAQTRGPVHEAAREAVLRESWSAPARVLVSLLQDSAPGPESRAISIAADLSQRPGLRVAVIAPPHRRGSAERFLREIVTELAAHPSQPAVTLYADSSRSTAAGRETEAALSARGGRTVDAGSDLDGALAADGDEIDVVWTTWPHGQLPPAGRAALVTTFHDLHWRFFWTLSAQAVEEIEAQMPAWLERTAVFVSSAEFIRGQLCEEYAVAPERTRVVPLTGMRPLPVSQAAAGEVRRRFCLPRHFFLFPNGRHPHKNHVALERALELLRAEGSPMHVVTTSEETATWYHGPDMIGLGYVGDETLRALYELSDGLVTPTLYEAGSFPMFEAMMVGRPVACSRIPPLVEQLERDGATAELFDPNDPTDIAAALGRLRHMGPVRRAQLVRRNRRAVGRRSWADVADGYLQVFAEAVAAQRSVGTAAGEP